MAVRRLSRRGLSARCALAVFCAATEASAQDAGVSPCDSRGAWSTNPEALPNPSSIPRVEEFDIHAWNSCQDLPRPGRAALAYPLITRRASVRGRQIGALIGGIVGGVGTVAGVAAGLYFECRNPTTDTLISCFVLGPWAIALGGVLGALAGGATGYLFGGLVDFMLSPRWVASRSPVRLAPFATWTPNGAAGGLTLVF